MSTPSAGLITPGFSAFAITPDDDDDLAQPTRGLYVGVSGDVKVDMASLGTAVIFAGLSAGIVHPLQVTKVYAADTTATSIVGVY